MSNLFAPHNTSSSSCLASSGDFSQEQLQLAGLAVPEGNVDRQGAEDFVPGSDEENLDDGLGRDDSRPAAPPEQAPAGLEEINLEDLADQVSHLELDTPDSKNKGSMTYRKLFHTIPGFECLNNTVTKTMFLCQVDLPGGVTEATAILRDDLSGVRIAWNEPGRAFSADDVSAELDTNPMNAPIRPVLRLSYEDEIASRSNNLERVNNSVGNYADFEFPEKAEEQLFNPYTHDVAGVVYIRTLIGGRCIAMVAAWQRRNTPIQQALDMDAMSLQEQIRKATAAYPGLATVVQIPAAANPQMAAAAQAALQAQLVQQQAAAQAAQQQAMAAAAAQQQQAAAAQQQLQQQQQAQQQLQQQLQQVRQQLQQAQQAQAQQQPQDQALLQPLLQKLRQSEAQLQQQEQQQATDIARRVQEESDRIRQDYTHAIGAQRAELEGKFTNVMGSVGAAIQGLTPQRLQQLGPTGGLQLLIARTIQQSEVTQGTRAGLPAGAPAGAPATGKGNLKSPPGGPDSRPTVVTVPGGSDGSNSNNNMSDGSLEF